MSKCKLHPEYLRQKALQEALLARKNRKSDFYNGIYDRWEYPVLTREHIPLEWRFDLDPAANPYFMERLGVNAVFNAGAIELDGKFYLVARVEGNDRKSFFAVTESDSPVDGFRFWDKPVQLPDICPDETNVYDMRLTKHEDGWIYGVFCSESKDKSNPDLSAAVAAAGIVRTRDLKTWERVGDVSNGAIARDNGEVYIYYAASDTRLHVASTTVDRLLDFAFNTPSDPLRSCDCVAQRCALIDWNSAYLASLEK